MMVDIEHKFPILRLKTNDGDYLPGDFVVFKNSGKTRGAYRRSNDSGDWLYGDDLDRIASTFYEPGYESERKDFENLLLAMAVEVDEFDKKAYLYVKSTGRYYYQPGEYSEAGKKIQKAREEEEAKMLTSVSFLGIF